jgi:5-methylcytosine-specific restriction endonuclease McrA
MSNKKINRKNRHLREKAAKLKGDHLPIEWEEMVEFFENTCAMCFGVGFMTKDHIIPIAHGGSNSIKNLQPLCRSCNSGKMDVCDYRLNLANYLGKKLPLQYRQNLSYHGETFYGY